VAVGFFFCLHVFEFLDTFIVKIFSTDLPEGRIHFCEFLGKKSRTLSGSGISSSSSSADVNGGSLSSLSSDGIRSSGVAFLKFFSLGKVSP